jgi:hypothetical protein
MISVKYCSSGTTYWYNQIANILEKAGLWSSCIVVPVGRAEYGAEERLSGTTTTECVADPKANWSSQQHREIEV